MFDLLKIMCLGGFYILNIGNAKETSSYDFQKQAEKLLTPILLLRLSCWHSRSLSNSSGNSQRWAKIKAYIIVWQPLQNHMLHYRKCFSSILFAHGSVQSNKWFWNIYFKSLCSCYFKDNLAVKYLLHDEKEFIYGKRIYALRYACLFCSCRYNAYLMNERQSSTLLLIVDKWVCLSPPLILLGQLFS